MNQKPVVALLCGGKSAEHAVSLQSAKNVFAAIDQEKYQVIVIAIQQTGKWHLVPDPASFFGAVSSGNEPFSAALPAVSFIIDQHTNLIELDTKKSLGKIDLVFPVLHGPMGEDGTVQGMLTVMGIPFVGAGVLGSAIGMDKDVMKRLLQQAGIPVANFLVVPKHEQASVQFSDITNRLGLPLFVKPANLGSSVGVSKVTSAATFQQAIETAFRFDTKILIEQAINGKEIECSVLGNAEPIVSVPGEIVPTHEFYSYEAKYLDENGATVAIPATLPLHVIETVQAFAKQTYTTLCCEGMARVDMFVTPDEHVYVNEINTLPGFTNISMYPKLWEASGISQQALIERLLSLALARAEQQQLLQTSYTQ